jgi:hypothetical protein
MGKMKIARSYEEAYAFGAKYITNISASRKKGQSVPSDEMAQTLPPEIHNPIWEISLTSLANTLKYIFEFLHHQCYMLCIHDNKIRMCRLETQTTAPIFSEILDKHLNKLDTNSQISTTQKKYIRDFISQNHDKLRVMQCIVKPFKDNETLTDNEYLSILRGLDLPDGVFILNLTDAIILRRDGKSPFQMATGRVSYPEYNFDKHLPILSMSGQRNYLDIPIPNYDDINVGNLRNLTVVWSDKPKNIAVFRGGPTGCGYTAETNMRIKLGTMSASPLLDVRITKPANASSIDTKSIRFDPKYGLGMMNTKMNFDNQYLSMAEQSKYKYIIHVDGNVNAYRLLTTMMTGSLILRVISPYTSWAEHMMKHKVHYIPVKSDLSDLLDVIKWCRKNDDKCKEIANNGMMLARKLLSKEFVRSYLKNILWSGVEGTNSSLPKPPSREEVVAAPSTLAPIRPLPSDNKEPVISDKREGSQENRIPALIEMPDGKKRCPKGYSATTVSNRKMCKKNITAKKR